MNTDHKLNLIRLASYLLRNERKGSINGIKFDMNYWIASNDSFQNAEWLMNMAIERKAPCGTSCCAIGEWMILNKIRPSESVGFTCARIIQDDFGMVYTQNGLFGNLNKHCVKDFAMRSLHHLGIACEEGLSKSKLLSHLKEAKQQILKDHEQTA